MKVLQELMLEDRAKQKNKKQNKKVLWSRTVQLFHLSESTDGSLECPSWVMALSSPQRRVGGSVLVTRTTNDKHSFWELSVSQEKCLSCQTLKRLETSRGQTTVADAVYLRMFRFQAGRRFSPIPWTGRLSQNYNPPLAPLLLWAAGWCLWERTTGVRALLLRQKCLLMQTQNRSKKTALPKVPLHLFSYFCLFPRTSQVGQGKAKA